MMKPIEQLSLGWRTDLIFARFDAEVQMRSDHLLVRTPHNPSFYWGNFLLYDRAPREGDAADWLAAFESEIAASQPESRHIAIGIDCAEPFEMPRDFAAAGLAPSSSTVLTMRRAQLRAPRKTLAPSFEVRALQMPQQAALAVELQLASDPGGFEPDGYRRFRELQMQRYCRMIDAGLGHWFGVFASHEDKLQGGGAADGASLVADCGLFRDQPGPQALGRFQFVSTHPAWRRQGLCSALIHAVCRHGFEQMGLEELVIVADPDDVAIVAYESVGFQRGATAWGLERRAPAA